MSEAVGRLGALGFLVGEWTLDYAYSLEPGGPPRTDLAGRGTVRPILGGTHLCFDYRVRHKETGEPAGSAHGIFAWDGELQRYRYFWFESSGTALQATAHLGAPDTLLLEWDNDCTQSFQRVDEDTVLLRMTCPEQGLTLRVEMTRMR